MSLVLALLARATLGAALVAARALAPARAVRVAAAVPPALALATTADRRPLAGTLLLLGPLARVPLRPPRTPLVGVLDRVLQRALAVAAPAPVARLLLVVLVGRVVARRPAVRRRLLVRVAAAGVALLGRRTVRVRAVAGASEREGADAEGRERRGQRRASRGKAAELPASRRSHLRSSGVGSRSMRFVRGGVGVSDGMAGSRDLGRSMVVVVRSTLAGAAGGRLGGRRQGRPSKQSGGQTRAPACARRPRFLHATLARSLAQTALVPGRSYT